MRTQTVKPSDLKRVVVIGSSCVGKTTFAKRLAAILDVKHIEIDRLNWLPQWRERPNEELRKLVEQETSAKSWVVDGNYSRVRDITWPRATHIVWLDYSFPVVLYRAMRRTIRRAYTKEEVCNGNRETFRQTFFSTDSMILWVLKTFRSRRRRYKKLVAETDDVRFIVIEKSPEADDFLQLMRNRMSAKPVGK